MKGLSIYVIYASTYFSSMYLCAKHLPLYLRNEMQKKRTQNKRMQIKLNSNVDMTLIKKRVVSNISFVLKVLSEKCDYFRLNGFLF